MGSALTSAGVRQLSGGLSRTSAAIFAQQPLEPYIIIIRINTHNPRCFGPALIEAVYRIGKA